ncbi:MAG: hemerythrin domain-containing protein [SAR324 cluster bacterium]|jgi:hemerythrin-like domain-containing protein|uniref:Hemerythrin-like domain-containing protein n=1 Tax=marine metagenome TaxID=408172 RepID=A0A382R2Y4_9ZZZZ|nr:hemerythrin HHE cation-binding protein [Pseudomonadota bacterium]MDP6245208.1 hemerythrin domain-containing protein [SAR324 cluster bacterium]MEE1576212.1 hemerythrin domain-containing protein [Deltaproteobacteria bacterium]MDP6330777.1 hemerythrin domain-containing protein [SAR324 cluster bacterium]MDP6463377.1 hemerythrin domain-containing protein [SAR324 cluster bacterium]|tara:strand:- start:2581 stop:3027 length:447 start_codon:yes stop_codon:yes gene_type:complete
MKTLLEFMQIHHGQCDQLYADGENSLLDEQMEEGVGQITIFLSEMERHFLMEETVLFPTFEDISGMRQGPTQVMRMEHQQIRNLLARMSDAVTRMDRDEILEVGETLLILMQQHNMKEEGILYPMVDQHLAPYREELMDRMNNVVVSA